MKPPRLWFAAVLVALTNLLLPGICFSQLGNTATDDKITISFPNIPLPVILAEYENLTGKLIVRDSAVLGASLSIETQKELTPAEAAQFIEKSLLLNGYALIPNGKDTLKIIAFSDGKQPISEGVPVITRREQLPETDEVVTYLVPLNYLSPADATKELGEIFTVHSYGKVVGLESASALSITENAFTIQKMLQVLERLDLPPNQIRHRKVALERAEAEEVVEAVSDLLGLNDSAPEGDAGEATAELQTSQTQRTTTRQYLGGLRETREVRPRIRAIPRSNEIIIVGQPHDIEYIETMILSFDGPARRRCMVKRKLNYLPVTTLLPVAQHTLLRDTAEDTSSTTSVAGGEEVQRDSVSTAGLSGSAGASSSSEDVQDLGPQSMIVGKTLLIADSIQNTLYMSGPEEDLEALNNLIDSMDIIPRQILISAVIAQLTLDKDFEYGLDFLRTLGDDGAPGTGGVFRSRSGSIVNPEGLTNFNNLLPAASGLTLYGQLAPSLDGILSAAESQNRFKVLSRPMVYTLNNRRAEILSGQRIAVPRSQQSVLSPNQVNTNQVVTSSIDFEEVLLRIEVIPLINADDLITLQIAQTNEDIIGNQVIGGDQIPTIGTQALKTTVIVPDGGTILLGGLISEEDSKTKNGIPIMVNVPLVGDVFGNTDIEKNRQELMIFIQPRIIDNCNEMRKSEEDLSERTVFLDETMEFAKPQWEARATPISTPKKRGLLKRLFQLDKMDATLTSP